MGHFGTFSPYSRHDSRVHTRIHVFPVPTNSLHFLFWVRGTSKGCLFFTKKTLNPRQNQASDFLRLGAGSPSQLHEKSLPRNAHGHSLHGTKPYILDRISFSPATGSVLLIAPRSPRPPRPLHTRTLAIEAGGLFEGKHRVTQQAQVPVAKLVCVWVCVCVSVRVETQGELLSRPMFPSQSWCVCVCVRARVCVVRACVVRACVRACIALAFLRPLQTMLWVIFKRYLLLVSADTRIICTVLAIQPDLLHCKRDLLSHSVT